VFLGLQLEYCYSLMILSLPHSSSISRKPFLLKNDCYISNGKIRSLNQQYDNNIFSFTILICRHSTFLFFDRSQVYRKKPKAFMISKNELFGNKLFTLEIMYLLIYIFGRNLIMQYRGANYKRIYGV
jgi:hypothetical protein